MKEFKTEYTVVALWFAAYIKCSDEIQSVVRDMFAIISDETSEASEKEMAAITIIEAIFPMESKHVKTEFNGETKTFTSEQLVEKLLCCLKDSKIRREITKNKLKLFEIANLILSSESDVRMWTDGDEFHVRYLEKDK
jgi:hypothetical protein